MKLIPNEILFNPLKLTVLLPYQCGLCQKGVKLSFVIFDIRAL